MEAIFAPINIIKKIQGLNKNCVIILGNEPVVSNHIKSDIKTYSDLNNIEYKSLRFDSSNKLDQIRPLFENTSLFSNQTIFNISITSGRILEETKIYILKVSPKN